MKKWPVVATVLIGCLVLSASLLGILYERTYIQETENWAFQATGQDIGNIIAVIVLFSATYLWRDGSKKAFLVWFGALFYLLYAYIIYAFALHFNFLFLIYVAILGVVVYVLLGSGTPYLKHLSLSASTTSRRFPAYVLIGTGILFGVLWLLEIIPALLSGTVPVAQRQTGLWVNPVYVIDLAVVLPGMVLAGVSLKKSGGMGGDLVAPWLVFSVLMGVSIVATMIIMSAKGYEGTVPPMVMVSAAVLASIVALFKYLRNLKV